MILLPLEVEQRSEIRMELLDDNLDKTVGEVFAGVH